MRNVFDMMKGISVLLLKARDVLYSRSSVLPIVLLKAYIQMMVELATILAVQSSLVSAAWSSLSLVCGTLVSNISVFSAARSVCAALYFYALLYLPDTLPQFYVIMFSRNDRTHSYCKLLGSVKLIPSIGMSAAFPRGLIASSPPEYPYLLTSYGMSEHLPTWRKLCTSVDLLSRFVLLQEHSACQSIPSDWIWSGFREVTIVVHSLTAPLSESQSLHSSPGSIVHATNVPERLIIGFCFWCGAWAAQRYCSRHVLFCDGHGLTCEWKDLESMQHSL